MYILSARYNEQDEVFTMYRYSSPARWYISIVPEGEAPGGDGDRDFYYVYMVDSDDPLPPRTGWISCTGRGSDPVPTVSPYEAI